MGCPSPQAWLDYAAARLDAVTRDAMAAHLGGCEACLLLAGEALHEHRDAPTMSAGAAPTRAGSPERRQRQARHQADAALTATPQRIGRYVVIELLGKGGMGEVLLAYDPALDRRVALKLARRQPGDDTNALEARLEREAQALARAADRHVVGVYDTGRVGQQPWVAMEFVPGTNLKHWLKASHPKKEILRVFVEAAQGLAAAHRVGVVHRDFKPENVLLDERGTARVTDFGLALLAEREELPPARPEGDEEADLQQLHTATGSVMGTPGYMSPEQWDAKPTDARSDQFSFCVSLHEALLGLRPFHKPSIRHTRPTFERTPESLARLREQPAPLRAVLTRGLQVDPGARFPSMEALLVELHKVLRPSRARWVVAASAVAVLSAGGLAWAGRSPCHDAATHIASKRQVALEGRALDVARALEAEWADAWQTACVETHEKKQQPPQVLALRNACLARQARRYELLVTRLAGPQPEVSATALEALELGPRAADCLPVEPLLAADAPTQAQAAQVEALRRQLDAARVALDVGQFDDAAASLAALSAPVQAAQFRRLHAELSAARAQLARATHDWATARQQAHEALALAVASRDFELAAGTSIDLLYALAMQGEVAEAELSDALAAALAGRLDNPRLDGALENVRGTVARERGRLDDARAHFERALRLREATLGPQHLETAKALHNLGIISAQQGHAAEAEAFHRRALALHEATLGATHPSVARVLESLGRALLAQKQPDEALAVVRRAWEVRRDALGPAHPLTRYSAMVLGRALRDVGRVDEARAWLTALAEDPADDGEAASQLWRLEYGEKQYEASLRWARRAGDRAAPGSEARLWEEEHQALSLLGLRRNADALALADTLVDAWKRRKDADTYLADVLLVRARALLALQKAAAARRDAGEALRLYEAARAAPEKRAEAARLVETTNAAGAK